MEQKQAVLIVEDDPSVLTLLEMTLTRTGYEVVRARDGEEGLRMAKGNPRVPDLVLADIMMPRMDGYEMRTALLADAATRGIPFIYLTAKTARVDKAKAFALGSYRYLTKPFTQGTVLEAIKAALADTQERNRLTALATRKLSGNLAETPVASLVDYFVVNRYDGSLRVHSGHSAGSVRFEKGEISYSDIGKGNTWAALEELLEWRDGTFEMERTGV
jgi:DNA-binding response OmpR family regulator